MTTIQLNEKGSRFLDITEKNFQTIHEHALFRHLVDSTGFVDEAVLDKLKMHVRSLIAAQAEDSKDLLDLCIDVIYHEKMKAYGLKRLMKAYSEWEATRPAPAADAE